MRAPRALVFIALIALSVLPAACRAPGDNDRLDDEAMKRARALHKDPDDAAREYYPKEIHDYFPGMDQVVVTGAAAPTVNILDTPVYQLMDKMLPANPVKLNAINLPYPVRVEGKGTCSDYGPAACEVLGRNTWMLWAGGNEGFWDWLSLTFGFIDLLKLVDSRDRTTRFGTGGLINEPGMEKATAPDEFGLWLDVPRDPEVRQWRADYLRRAFGMPSAGASSVGSGGIYGPGATAGSGGSSGSSGGIYGSGPTYQSMAAYGQGTAYNPKIPPPEIYGLSSGVLGLRLFPNPNFNADAQKRWKKACGDRAANAGCRAYYDDPAGDPTLIRPFRVGMACAFCHVSYHPLNPPRDLVNPEWVNISGNIGAQYLRPRVAFGNLLPKNNFVYHVLDSQPPGTIDTSLIASDNINNPNTMNAVFNLPQRALLSMRLPKEQVRGASSALPSIWKSPNGDGPDPPPEFWKNVFQAQGLLAELSHSNDNLRRVPRVLFDGADSIGAYGALARVYLNIGTNYEQWRTLQNTVVGFAPQKPFTIDGTLRHSVYWRATQLRVPALRDYFLKVTPPMPVLQAGGESERPPIKKELLAPGRHVFARNCIVCHSSIQPPQRFQEMAEFAAGHNGEFWEHNPGHWLSDPEYLKWADAQVEDPAFWSANFLSTDYRVPVNLVNTNACRAMATNAIAGHMWEDFSSASYKALPSPGAIPFFNPYLGPAGQDSTFTPRHATAPDAPAGGGGPGFYRVPSLVSIWATAPFLHNNSLGLFNNDPSVHGRLAAFDDAIKKLLWPAERLKSSSYNDADQTRLTADHGLIWRTTEDSYLTIGAQYLPQLLGSRVSFVRSFLDRYPALSHVPRWLQPLPSAVLLLVAFLVLRATQKLRTRLIGYALVILALAVGGALYFLSGSVGGLRIGPIPKGTPVGLLANANPDADRAAIKNALATVTASLIEIRSRMSDKNEVEQAMHTRVAPALMQISKCPDFVMDHGHYYKWFESMTDDDKRALIELLKTF